MSPDAKVVRLLDALLPAADALQFVESRSPCAAVADIGMPSLRVAKATGSLSGITSRATSPLVTMTDPALLRFLYRSLRDEALASDPDALNDLGWLWINGSRVSVDIILAWRLFKLAYVLGSGEAAFNLAEQAWYGRGMCVSHDLAAKYYEQAYDRGITNAAGALGLLHEKGVGGSEPDFGLATHWYRLAFGAASASKERCYRRSEFGFNGDTGTDLLAG
jgi:TPR repeat protein